MPLDFRQNQNNAPGTMGPPPGAVTPNQAMQAVQNSATEELMINYNKKFANGMPAKYRDKEIFTVISQLMMSQKSCSLLVGAPGVGKTKIVEEIARLIAAKSPYTNTLNEYTVYELPLTNLMSGTSYRGDLELRVKELVEYCENNKVILFIDEIHQLIDGQASMSGIAQMLKPAMARGSIKIIGATTTQESKNLLDDPAFNRRFNKVQVCELSIEQTVDIIQTVYIPKMGTFYGCSFANNLAKIVVEAAERSKTITCHRPDNAITMLDQICANTVLTRNYNIATCQDPAVKQTLQATPCVVNANHVELFNREANFTLPDSFDSLKSKLLYQDKAVDALYENLKEFVQINELFPEKKPLVLKIFGADKTGKTTLAKLAAEMIDESPVYLDLADYSDAPSLNRIIGSPMGYVGSDSKKEMPFDIIESSPRKVIILDNLDCCHAVIHDFFESAIDTALIKYADNRMIDISKCIIIITSHMEKKTATIGLVVPEAKTAKNEITMEILTDNELVDGTKTIMRQLIAGMKSSHTKYSSLPDELDLTAEDEKGIINVGDMTRTAKNVILRYINQPVTAAAAEKK